MPKKIDYDACIKRLNDAAQLITIQKEQVKLSRDTMKNSINVLAKEKPKEVYMSIGSIFIKYPPKETKAKLEKKIEAIDLQLRILDRKMNQIWAESQKLQEEMRTGKGS